MPPAARSGSSRSAATACPIMSWTTSDGARTSSSPSRSPTSSWPGQPRASAHTDYGGFTILSGEEVPGGLQVRTRRGRWIDVRTSPTTFVVNIGDLLMRWTNDRWLSNMHRVVNPSPADTPNAAPRLSIAFFNHPNYDTLIESLPSQGPAKYPPVLAGEYRDAKYAKTALTGVSVRAPS